VPQLVACANSTFGVGITVAADATVTDMTLASVSVLSVRATGDETYRYDLPLSRPMLRQEDLRYTPLSTSRAVTIEIDALDGAGKVLASGSTGALQLNAGQTFLVNLVLRSVANSAGPCDVDPSPPSGDVIAAHCAIDTPPTIDGALGEWSDATFTPLTHANAAAVFGVASWSGTAVGDDGDLSGSFAARWDRQFLYIAAQVRDNHRAGHPEVPNTEYFNADGIELYLDGRGDRTNTYNEDDHHIIIRVDGAIQEAKNSAIIPPMLSGMVVKTADSPVPASWNIEVAVPWTLLGPSSAMVGRQLGFDFQLDDCDTDAMPQLDHALISTLQSVAGCDQPSCSTATFARMQLTGK
jgi:hypothetical protein